MLTTLLLAMMGALAAGVVGTITAFNFFAMWSEYRVRKAQQSLGARPTAQLNRLAKQRRLLNEAGFYNVPVLTYMGARIGATIAVGLLVNAGLGVGMGIFCAFSTFFGATQILKMIRGNRKKQVREAVLVFTRNFLNLIRSGMMPTEAMTLLSSRYGPPELRAALGDLSREIRDVGMYEAVRRSKEKVGDPLFDLLAVSLVVVTELGTPMRDLLESTLKGMEQSNSVIRRATSAQGSQKLSALIVPFFFSVIVFGAQLFSGRTGYYAAYNTVIGQIVEIIAIGFFVAGYFLLKILQKLPEIPRMELRNLHG